MMRQNIWILTFVLAGGVSLFADTDNPQDANINAIRGLSTISEVDQRKIADWVEGEITICTSAVGKDPSDAWKQFRTRFDNQLKNTANSPQFVTQLAIQTAAVAARHLQKTGDGAQNPSVSRVLVSTLKGLNKVEVHPGLLAGLKSPDAATRAICIGGLDDLKTPIAADPQRLTDTIAALKQAGVTETSPVVIARIYLAMSYPGQAAQVFEPMMNVLDVRLKARRTQNSRADGAENDLLEYFRDAAVVKALTPEQKAQLAGRLATLLRLDVERFDNAQLSEEEIEVLARSLEGTEEILVALIGDAQKGGKIRSELEQGGHANHKAVREQAAKWIGDSVKNEPGALNAAPWNVPVGAP